MKAITESYREYEDNYNQILKWVEEDMSLSQIARNLNLKPSKLRRYLTDFKGAPHMKDRSTPMNVLKKAKEIYLEGEKSVTEIAKMFTMNRKRLSRELQSTFGIEIRKHGKKCLDSSYFNEIDASDKSYWLGIMYTDGYVSDSNGVELCLKDKEHVMKFKKAVGSSHRISAKTTELDGKTFTSWRISITDTEFSNGLKSNGCINNKTFDLSFPTLPEELYPDFIRGCFDGDGSISLTPQAKGGYRVNLTFTSGCLSFLNELAFFLKQRLGIDFIIDKDERTETTHRGRLNKDDAVKFLDYIYRNSLKENRMDRKYDSYISLIKTLPSRGESH